MSRVSVQTEDFDTDAIISEMTKGRQDIGALVSFTGLVRDLPEQSLQSMTLEHYPGMTEKALVTIVGEAGERWSIDAVRVIHRVGALEPQDPIVLVAVASAHRGEAFRACEFIIDYLKTRAPFWKREQTADGGSRWVEARESDEDAAEAWRDGAGSQSG